MCSNGGLEGGGAVSDELVALLARLGRLADADTTPADVVSDAERIDRIGLMERVRAALSAAQHTEMVAFARSQAAAQIADERIDPARVGRGIADQVAMACHISPSAGSRRLEVARVLWAEMPRVRMLLAAGRLSEELAARIVSETSHLGSERRRLVDEQLAGDGLEEMGSKKAIAAVRRRAYEADRVGYTARGRKAREDRRVTLRPAPDTMSWLTLLLPVEQGAACYAALSSHADTHVGHDDEERTRGQVMADTAVERLTGQARAEDVNVEVNLVLPWDALDPEPDVPAPRASTEPTAPDPDPDPRSDPDPDLRSDPDPGRPGGPAAGDAASASVSGTPELVGYGPVPMGIVRDILASTAGRRWWRRLFTAPAGGALIGGDPRRRRFDGFLAHLLGLRDHGTCRDPYCDAPIRHLDHIRPARAGGPTSLANGRGVCARGNYVREMPGWRVTVAHDGLHDRPHTVRTTTPTGHTYTSRAGPAP